MNEHWHSHDSLVDEFFELLGTGWMNKTSLEDRQRFAVILANRTRNYLIKKSDRGPVGHRIGEIADRWSKGHPGPWEHTRHDQIFDWGDGRKEVYEAYWISNHEAPVCSMGDVEFPAREIDAKNIAMAPDDIQYLVNIARWAKEAIGLNYDSCHPVIKSVIENLRQAITGGTNG